MHMQQWGERVCFAPVHLQGYRFVMLMLLFAIYVASALAGKSGKGGQQWPHVCKVKFVPRIKGPSSMNLNQEI